MLTHVTKFTGEGLGSGKGGRADPVEAGSVKVNNLGVGAAQPGEVTAEDDIYEQYKKRMMLGYRYRPNPLVSSSEPCFVLLILLSSCKM
jgi:splicing factor 4